MTATGIALLALFMAIAALAVAALAFDLAQTNFKLHGMQLKLWEDADRLWWHHFQCHAILDERFGTQTATKPNLKIMKTPPEATN